MIDKKTRSDINEINKNHNSMNAKEFIKVMEDLEMVLNDFPEELLEKIVVNLSVKFFDFNEEVVKTVTGSLNGVNIIMDGSRNPIINFSGERVLL